MIYLNSIGKGYTGWSGAVVVLLTAQSQHALVLMMLTRTLSTLTTWVVAISLERLPKSVSAHYSCHM